MQSSARHTAKPKVPPPLSLLSPDARALNFPSRTFFRRLTDYLLLTHHLSRHEYILLVHLRVHHLSVHNTPPAKGKREEKERENTTRNSPIMSSMRNAVQRRNHKERAQPLERQKWGLLEKHKVGSFPLFQSARNIPTSRTTKSTTISIQDQNFIANPTPSIANPTPSKIGLLPPSKRPQ